MPLRLTATSLPAKVMIAWPASTGEARRCGNRAQRLHDPRVLADAARFGQRLHAADLDHAVRVELLGRLQARIAEFVRRP